MLSSNRYFFIALSSAPRRAGVALCTLLACSPGKDDADTAATGTAESGGPVTESSASEAGEEPVDSEGSQAELLRMCDLDDPCPATQIDACGGITCSDMAMQCMWPLLRDGAQFRMDWTEGVWIALGDPERTVLTTFQEGPQPAPVMRCPLLSPQFFADCIQNTGPDTCFIPGVWIGDCVPEPAPMCPAA